MVKNYNNIPEDWTPEPLNVNERGDTRGSETIKEQNILKKKAEIKEDSSSERDKIKEEIGHQEDFLDTLFAPNGQNNKTTHQPNSRNKDNFSAFFSFDTRIESDQGKGPILAVIDSGKVLLNAVGNIIIDTGKFLRSPINETKYAIAYQNETDPNIAAI